ncbi:unknown [Bacteroides sp. CAG:1060]|nr:unknown [Bacteroides sp. CAG:1060]
MEENNNLNRQSSSFSNGHRNFSNEFCPFSAVVTRTEMGNANICILCDVVKKVERRVLSLL